MYYFLSLLTVIVGGESGAVSDVAAAPAADAAASALPSLGGGLGGMIQLVGMYALMIGALWFFVFRPQRKRDKQAKEMQASIRAGDNIVTSSGFYGKVMDVGENCFIVEFGTNRGIRIPVNKSDVVGIKTPVLHSTDKTIEKSES